jgi:urate oxidase
MTLAERKFMKELDNLILTGPDSKLKKLQELDLRTQLEGSNFYDIFSKHNNKSAISSNTPSIEKKKRK